MLAANVCASEFLQKHEQPCLYRIHEGPTEEKLERLRNFLREFGLDLSGGDEPKAKDYAVLLERIKERPDAHDLRGLRRLREFYGDATLPGFVACTTAQPFDIADGMTAMSGWTPWTLPGMKP